MASGTFDILHPGHVFYLEEAKKLGGADCKLMVVIATDKTVHNNKRIPIIGQDQRAEMIKALGCVDEVFVGDENDPFKIVKQEKPDMIAIGPDQKFDPENLEEKLKNMSLNIKVVKIKQYREFELDSSCKIIQKIKRTNFTKKSFEDCDL